MAGRARSIPLRSLLVVACLLAQVAIASAPLWHHHDGVADSCSVCVTASSGARICQASRDLPPVPARVGFVSIEPVAAPGSAPAPAAIARGPPLSA